MSLDPDRPGPIDLLTAEQRAVYDRVYRETQGPPANKHEKAWKMAVKEKAHHGRSFGR